MCYQGDGADVWSLQRRKSRKLRECEECGELIPSGADYIMISMLYRGESWQKMPVHVECLALWEFVREEVCGGEGLIVIGGLEEEIASYEDVNTVFDEEGNAQTSELTLMSIYEAIKQAYRTEVTT